MTGVEQSSVKEELDREQQQQYQGTKVKRMESDHHESERSQEEFSQTSMHNMQKQTGVEKL